LRIASRKVVYGDVVPSSSPETFVLPASFLVQSRDGSDPIELQERELAGS
jgi:hypothetical protein